MFLQDTILNIKISLVFLTWVPAQSSEEKNPSLSIVTTLTISEYFSLNNPIALSAIAFLYSLFSILISIFLAITSLTLFSIFSKISLVIS